MNPILQSYAHLLIQYCVSLQKGEKLLIRSTTLAEPLVKEVYREALRAGGLPVIMLDIAEQERLFLQEADEHQLKFINPLYQTAINEYQAYIYIRAPHNMAENRNSSAKFPEIHQNALKPIQDTYFKRTATRELKRNLCEYPTQAGAQQAGMSLEEYQAFIYEACGLFTPNPIEHWLGMRKKQQGITDYLNRSKHIRYRSQDTDIHFSVEGRTWINSDGQTNMPSGEVYTSPVEESVNGTIYFSYPSLMYGENVEGVRLWVENGEVVRWEAKQGKSVLDKVFAIEGARRFGEAAIGTNYQIKQITKNILFDEKIGGSVHMALGQSYLQTGGKNQSLIHWDLITDMTQEGEIYADDVLIYEKGKFLID